MRLVQGFLFFQVLVAAPLPLHAAAGDSLFNCWGLIRKFWVDRAPTGVPAEILAKALNQAESTIIQSIVSAESLDSLIASFSLLEERNPKASFSVAEHLSHSKDPKVRALCPQWMFKNNAVASRVPLRRMLSDPSPAVRQAALEAIGSGGFFPPLEEIRLLAATEPDRAVREAAKGIAQIYDPTALKAALLQGQSEPQTWHLRALKAQGIVLSRKEFFTIAERVGRGYEFVLWIEILVPELADLNLMQVLPDYLLVEWALQGERPVLAHLAMGAINERKLSLPELFQIAEYAELQGVRRAAQALIAVKPHGTRHHPLYHDLQPDQWVQLTTCQPICRVKFDKTGPELYLLGGPLVGQVVLRIMPESAVEAWSKALNAKAEWARAGFKAPPIEPLLSVEDVVQTYKLPEESARALRQWVDQGSTGGNRAVFAGVVRGPSIRLLENAFFLGKEEHRKIIDQSDRIRAVVRDELHIEHGHDHLGNFVLDAIPGTGMTLIDFDQARILGKSSLKE